MSRVDDVVPHRVSHIGLVLFDSRGQVAVYRPAVPKNGVTAALPRLRRLEGENPARTLVRCWTETLGVQPEWVFPIRQVWGTPYSTSYFFAGAISVGTVELAPGAIWCPLAQARQLISGSAAGPGRDRDLDALEAATRMCLSPHRRVLEMVGELHRMGYEQLRACCYLYALGTWRCAVVPAAWTFREHGGMFRCPHREDGSPFSHAGLNHTTYTSATEQGQPFDSYFVPDVEFASPRQMAEAFVVHRPLVSYTGRGPDPEYVRWFRGAMDTLRPIGVYYAFAEGQEAGDRLYTAHTDVEALPLPPPGVYPRWLWNAYLAE